MGTFLIRRLFVALLLMFVISIISFCIYKLTPGSSLHAVMMDPKLSPAVKETYVRKFRLDRPIHEQYWYIITDLFRGELVSHKDQRPVMEKIGERLPATLRLNILALFLEFAFGIPWGVYAARHWRSWRDRFSTFWAFVFVAIPSFWISYLICIALVKFAGVPILGVESFGVVYATGVESFLDRLWHLFVPASVLALSGVAVVSRFVRASTLETLGEDFIRTARAKGLDALTVFYKHALRNSLRPVITMMGFLLPALIGGSVIVESIFAYPGLGRLGYEAVMERDYPVLVTINLITAALVLIGNLIADLLYAVVDPRVRLS